MSSNVLADRDVNATSQQQPAQKGDVKSMEYHRQMLQSKIAEGQAKPKSLFATAQSKNLNPGALFGEQNVDSGVNKSEGQ
ncbi:MAG: hypothetical protein M1818_000202 [Claussenomyces sp. TS43310]|nr:MAG: hypothetical protein M1818_000202 [Claussenomyces sp. TS43310]